MKIIDAYPEANPSQVDPSSRPFMRRQAKNVQKFQGLAQGILYHDFEDNGESMTLVLFNSFALRD